MQSTGVGIKHEVGWSCLFFSPFSRNSLSNIKWNPKQPTGQQAVDKRCPKSGCGTKEHPYFVGKPTLPLQSRLVTGVERKNE
jgi:hypothetical protein